MILRGWMHFGQHGEHARLTAFLVMGDLNIDLEHPRNAREEDIANLLDEINLVDLSQKFTLRRCRMQSTKGCWTWHQK